MREVKPKRIVRSLIRELFGFSKLGRVYSHTYFSVRHGYMPHHGNIDYRIGPGEKYIRTRLVVCNGKIYLVVV